MAPKAQLASFRPIDELVDCLVTYFGLATMKAKVAGDLLWRPALSKTAHNVHDQAPITHQLAAAYSSVGRLLLRHPIEIAPKPGVLIIKEIALQLAVDRR